MQQRLAASRSMIAVLALVLAGVLAACTPGVLAPTTSDPSTSPSVQLELGPYEPTAAEQERFVDSVHDLPVVGWLVPGESLVVLFQAGGGEFCVPFPATAWQQNADEVTIEFAVSEPNATACPLPFIIESWQIELDEPLADDETLSYSIGGVGDVIVFGELPVDAGPLLGQ